MNKVNKEELNKFCKAAVLMTESNWFTGNELNNISFLSGLAYGRVYYQMRIIVIKNQ